MKKLLLITALVLSGCAAQPSQMVLAPAAPTISLTPQADASLNVHSQDQRIESFLVRINREGKPAELISAGINPRQILEHGLNQGLRQQGYHLDGDDGSKAKLTLNLERLLVDVNQDTFDYDAQSTATASVIIEQQQRRLEKRFLVKGKLNGIMAAEPARLEQELNDRLNQLLSMMLNDPELHQFIQ